MRAGSRICGEASSEARLVLGMFRWLGHYIRGSAEYAVAAVAKRGGEGIQARCRAARVAWRVMVLYTLKVARRMLCCLKAKHKHYGRRGG